MIRLKCQNIHLLSSPYTCASWFVWAPRSTMDPGDTRLSGKLTERCTVYWALALSTTHCFWKTQRKVFSDGHMPALSSRIFMGRSANTKIHTVGHVVHSNAVPDYSTDARPYMNLVMHLTLEIITSCLCIQKDLHFLQMKCPSPCNMGQHQLAQVHWTPPGTQERPDAMI